MRDQLTSSFTTKEIEGETAEKEIGWYRQSAREREIVGAGSTKDDGS
jgi:hypothetical protein